MRSTLNYQKSWQNQYLIIIIWIDKKMIRFLPNLIKINISQIFWEISLMFNLIRSYCNYWVKSISFYTDQMHTADYIRIQNRILSHIINIPQNLISITNSQLISIPKSNARKQQKSHLFTDTNIIERYRDGLLQ